MKTGHEWWPKSGLRPYFGHKAAPSDDPKADMGLALIFLSLRLLLGHGARDVEEAVGSKSVKGN
jgi:hypothetical protein